MGKIHYFPIVTMENKKERPCPICGRKFSDTQSVKRHCRTVHNQLGVEVPPSPPKPCPFCHEQFSRLQKHVNLCRLNPKNKKTPKAMSEMNNEEFIVHLRSYWNRPGSGLASSTVDLYIGKIKG